MKRTLSLAKLHETLLNLKLLTLLKNRGLLFRIRQSLHERSKGLWTDYNDNSGVDLEAK